MKKRVVSILIIGGCLIIPSAPAAGQAAKIRGTLSARETGDPLAFGSITIAESGEQRFTDGTGSFSFPVVTAGNVHLRIRHVGFVPLDTVLTIAEGQSLMMRAALTHVAVQLPAVRTEAAARCVHPGPPHHAADSSVFQQLLQNAQQFDIVTRSYPFLSVIERKQWERGSAQLLFTNYDTLVRASELQAPYAPGQVLVGDRYGRVAVRIPTLAILTDPRFLESHCFSVFGLERTDGRDLLRIDFQVASAIDKPDFNGSMYLDPASFVIRRTTVTLSRPFAPANLDSLSMETRFEEVVPFLPLPAETRGRNRLTPKGRSRVVEQLEQHRLLSVRFTERQPGSVAGTDTTGIRVGAKRGQRLLQVIDDLTGSPLDGVQIQDTLSKSTLVTGATGTVSLAFVPGDSAVLEFRRKGYRTTYHPVGALGRDITPIMIGMVKGRDP